VDRLVHALPEVFKKNKDSVCLIIGEGPEKQKLQKFVLREGIQSRALFMNSVERGRLKQLLNAADIFVLLSRYHNCTNTMWEAMVCGKCIVTIENAPIKEALTSGVNAVFLGPDDLKNPADILSRILADDKLRNELGNNAHRRAYEVLKPWSQRIGEEAELLEKLTAGKH
jgi:glycosyltransferase involved in cell wall biosynthesis